MKKQNTLTLLVKNAFILAAAIAFLGTGDGVREGGRKGRRFTELRRGEKSLVAAVFDEKYQNPILVKEISFTGETRIAGLLSEQHESSIEIDLGDIQEIIIRQHGYRSKRHPAPAGQNEWLLTRMITKEGNVIEDVLIPPQVQFSAKEIGTNLRHTWYLEDVEKIRVLVPQPQPGVPITNELVKKLLLWQMQKATTGRS